MTFPSSCAPLAGISRARLPARRAADGWPTQANDEPRLADRLSRWTDRRRDALRRAGSRPVGPGGDPDAPRPGGTPCPSGQNLYH